MKTTIDLADDLAVSFKKQTAREGISLRAAVHEALRLWLNARTPHTRSSRIPRDVGIVSGQGLCPDAAARSWDELRAISYESKL